MSWLFVNNIVRARSDGTNCMSVLEHTQSRIRRFEVYKSQGNCDIYTRYAHCNTSFRIRESYIYRYIVMFTVGIACDVIKCSLPFYDYI
jgi:hypothetical protein